VGVEYELALIYGRLGHPLAYPTPGEPSASTTMWPDRGRVVSLGIYFLWWYYNMMTEPNRHFYANWRRRTRWL